MMLFREIDKSLEVVEPDASDTEEDDSAPYVAVRYEAPATCIRDRLELMGFTLSAAKAVFDVAIEGERVSHRDSMARISGALPSAFQDDVGAVLETLTIEQWMEGLREIRDRRLRPTYRSDEALGGMSPVVRYMLGKHFDGWYGFPSSDVRHVIRIAVEVLPEENLVYDLTELIQGGYFDSSDDLVAHAEYLLTDDFDTTRRIVVLTEGATDKWILERSLRLLYSHLADFFTFMDFEGARVAGGAGALAAMVKAFVGAGILNRIVAVFDNDTAGALALHSLRQIRLPANIAVLKYPDLPLAEDYPTIGPSGLANMNVNGLAASLELYLGRDVLEDGDGMLPVQWKGYDETLKRYHGEVIAKREILERFDRKLAECEVDPSTVGSRDWTGLRLILQVLQTAFHPTDEQAMIDDENAILEEHRSARSRYGIPTAPTDGPRIGEPPGKQEL